MTTASQDHFSTWLQEFHSVAHELTSHILHIPEAIHDFAERAFEQTHKWLEWRRLRGEAEKIRIADDYPKPGPGRPKSRLQLWLSGLIAPSDQRAMVDHPRPT